MSLTKDELLNLAQTTKSVPLGNMGDITIRQLTTRETNQIELIRYNYTTIISNNDPHEQTINLVEQKKAEQKAKLTTIMYGLDVSDEKWTIDEIQELPAHIVDTIYKKIREFNK